MRIGERPGAVSVAAHVLVLAAPLAVPFVGLTSRQTSLATLTLLYAIVAFSMDLPWGYGGLLSLMPAALWGVGAFTTGYLVTAHGWNSWAAAVASVLVAGLVALAVSLPSLRARGFNFAIITFAFAEFLRIFGNNWHAVTNGQLGLFLPKPPGDLGPWHFGQNSSLFGLDLKPRQSIYFLVLLATYLTIAVVMWARRSSFGTALRMIKQNEPLARSLGFNTYRYSLLAAVLSGCFAGVAGHLFAYHQRVITPDLFGIFVAIQVLMMVVIGGTGTLLGPLVGAAFVIFLPEFLHLSPNDSRMVYGLLLVVFALALPHGIVGVVRDAYGDLSSGAWRTWPQRFGWRLHLRRREHRTVLREEPK